MKNNEIIIAVIAVVVGLFLISIFTAPIMGYTRYSYGMAGMMGYGFGSMWLFGWLFMVLIIVALVLLIMWLIKQLQNSSNGKRK